jgi:hypothetical protein
MQERSDAFQNPSSHFSTVHLGWLPVASHVMTALGTTPSHTTPQSPQWAGWPYFSVPGTL